MDKTPSSSTTKRAPKRPHSPTDDQPAAASSNPPDPPATEAADVLQSDSRRDKLMRLLGGKKRKNETAASKWLERVRSREDELKVSTELESQFNESLTHKLTGQTRRHIGIGFVEEKPPERNTAPGDLGNDGKSVPLISNDNKKEAESKTHGDSNDNKSAPQNTTTSNNAATYHPGSGPGQNYQPPHRFSNAAENGAVGNFAQTAYRNVHSGYASSQQYGNMGYGAYNPRLPGGHMRQYPNYPPPQPPGWMGGYNPRRFQMNYPPPPPPLPPVEGSAHYQAPPQSGPKQAESTAPKSKASFYAQFKKAS